MSQWVATNSSRALMASVLDIGVIKSMQISMKLYSKSKRKRRLAESCQTIGGN